MTNVLSLAGSERAQKTFYPTPDELALQLLAQVDFRDVEDILEPSAGKGDLAFMTCKVKAYGGIEGYTKYRRTELLGLRHAEYEYQEAKRIDCIEIDPNLRKLLTGNHFRVIHDNFLTFETQKRYDLIVMNPPFDQGVAHLMKAIELMEYGGQIACILNADNICHPYNQPRQRLVKRLEELGAGIRYVDNAFADAEREAEVDVALINIRIPKKKYHGSIADEMKRAPTYKAQSIPDEYSEIVAYNQIDEWVNRYNYEVGCGIRLIEEYDALKPNMLYESESATIETPMLELTVNVPSDEHKSLSATANNYIRAVRMKYWRAIFQNSMITQTLTSNLLNELRDRVSELRDYEFSAFNILTLIIQMTQRMVKGVEDTIMSLFDKWTYKYHWSEGTSNRHYYDGWRTNDCFRVNKKIIIPFHGYDSWDSRFKSYKVRDEFRDIEKAFDFLDCGRTDWAGDMDAILKNAEATQNLRNVDTKYFTVTFYKKGTCHIVFKDEDLLEKFNMFASQKKGWLPPDYGRKRYSDMTKEEQHVVDSFQGKAKYEEVMARADYFLNDGQNPMLMLNGGKE